MFAIIQIKLRQKSTNHYSTISLTKLSMDWTRIYKGAGSFHIHRKTMKDLGILAVLGVREQPKLARNLVTHRH